MNPEACKHAKVMPTFDEAAAKTLLEGCSHPPNLDPIDGPFGICNPCTNEIRKRWPRFMGTCPECFGSVIAYASTSHYTYGDW